VLKYDPDGVAAQSYRDLATELLSKTWNEEVKVDG
jgi:hypothetical protein